MASEVDHVVKSLLSGELNQKHLFFTLLAEKLINLFKILSFFCEL